MNRPIRFALGDDGEYVAAGAGGWCYWHRPDWHDVRVRVSWDAQGRAVVRALHVEVYDVVPGPESMVADERGLTGSDLRELAVGRLEAALSAPPVRKWLDGVHRSGPDFRPGKMSGADAHAMSVKTRLKRLDAEAFVGLSVLPTSSRRDDDFYRHVAQAFMAASVNSNRPAMNLAAANGVPDTTVHRWLKEARRRGFLAPAKRKDAADWKGHRQPPLAPEP